MKKYLIIVGLVALALVLARRWAAPASTDESVSRDLASQARSGGPPVAVAPVIDVPVLPRGRPRPQMPKELAARGATFRLVRTGQHPGEAISADERLRALGLQAVPTPGPVPLRDGNYAIVPDVYAMTEQEFRSASQVTVVERSAGVVYFRPAPGALPPKGAMPAAINTGNATLGMLTGIVEVKPNGRGELDSLGADYGLSLVQSFDALNLAYFRSGRSREADLNSLLAALRKDERVRAADLTILNNLAHTR